MRNFRGFMFVMMAPTHYQIRDAGREKQEHAQEPAQKFHGAYEGWEVRDELSGDAEHEDDEPDYQCPQCQAGPAAHLSDF